jgi:hypothetical protein
MHTTRNEYKHTATLLFLMYLHVWEYEYQGVHVDVIGYVNVKIIDTTSR